MHHFVGYMRKSHRMMFTPILLALIDRGEKGIPDDHGGHFHLMTVVILPQANFLR